MGLISTAKGIEKLTDQQLLMLAISIILMNQSRPGGTNAMVAEELAKRVGAELERI